MDIALKQRLVGASVLIALAVVVLPMLLGGRPNESDSEPQKIELPRQPSELDFETRRYPIGKTPAPVSGESKQVAVKPLPTPSSTPAPLPSAETIPATDPGSTEQPPPQQSPVSAAQPPVEESIKPEPETAKAPAATQGGRYVVQVASFGAVDNANRLSETLRGYGYDVLLDTIKSDIGTLHRVRVGPFDGEVEANENVARIRSQVDGVKPRVMDLQPENTAQLTAPSDPLVRWVVQVGSFASAVNADNLVAKLRLQSLTAYAEEVNSSGSSIYRVRVGPFLKREDAIQADALIKEKLSLDGVVMSAN
jgi:cell division septation protein DedD